MLLLFGITALAHSPLAPANTPTPTPSSQDGLRPQGAPTTDQNDDGDMNVDDQSGDVEAGDSESGDMETGDTQSGDMQAGDSQSGAQQDGEFEGDN
jgi:hypothetical protein